MNDESKLPSGAFSDSLLRNNKKIRDDRAIAIATAAQRRYKRSIEDIEDLIRDKRLALEYMLDLSPTTADSLVLATDFDANDFVEKDKKIALDIRNLEIQLEVAKKRYNYLFNDNLV